MKGKGPLHN